MEGKKQGAMVGGGALELELYMLEKMLGRKKKSKITIYRRLWPEMMSSLHYRQLIVRRCYE